MGTKYKRKNPQGLKINHSRIFAVSEMRTLFLN